MKRAELMALVLHEVPTVVYGTVTQITPRIEYRLERPARFTTRYWL